MEATLLSARTTATLGVLSSGSQCSKTRQLYSEKTVTMLRKGAVCRCRYRLEIATVASICEIGFEYCWAVCYECLISPSMTSIVCVMVGGSPIHLCMFRCNKDIISNDNHWGGTYSTLVKPLGNILYHIYLSELWMFVKVSRVLRSCYGTRLSWRC